MALTALHHACNTHTSSVLRVDLFCLDQTNSFSSSGRRQLNRAETFSSPGWYQLDQVEPFLPKTISKTALLLRKAAGDSIMRHFFSPSWRWGCCCCLLSQCARTRRLVAMARARALDSKAMDCVRVRETIPGLGSGCSFLDYFNCRNISFITKIDGRDYCLVRVLHSIVYKVYLKTHWSRYSKNKNLSTRYIRNLG